jgi:putative flippase GtrA
MNETDKKLTSVSVHREAQRFSRFLLVGAVGTCLDFSLLALLKNAGLGTILANSLSYSAGIMNNFVWNRRWTFQITGRKGVLKQFMQFALVSLVGLVLNDVIVSSLESVFDRILPVVIPGYMAAKLAATLLVLFWNYAANRQWTFRAAPSHQWSDISPSGAALPLSDRRNG